MTEEASKSGKGEKSGGNKRKRGKSEEDKKGKRRAVDVDREDEMEWRDGVEDSLEKIDGVLRHIAGTLVRMAKMLEERFRREEERNREAEGAGGADEEEEDEVTERMALD